jgi:hypothetical protein
MSENKVKVNFCTTGADGQQKRQEASFGLSDYKEAGKRGVSLRQYVNEKLSADADHSFGQPFDQVCQSVGIYTGNSTYGGVSPTIGQLFSGQSPMAAGFDASANSTGSIVSPGGNDSTVAGRLFYPEILMDRIRSSLTRDNSDVEQGFEAMIAVTESIAGGHYIQPIINVSQSEGVSAQPIGQDAEPAVMMSITAASSSKRIATKSIGLRITDEAAAYASLDLVATAVEAQTRGERIRMIESDVKAIIMGDKDAGMSALPAKLLSAYGALDSGKITQRQFLKILHEQYQKRNLNAAIMSLDTYLDFEGRTGRPSVMEDNGTDGRVNADIRPVNLSLGNVPVLLLDEATIGAGNALFLDTRFALRKVINVFAAYDAVENFVMRRSSMLRMDYGQHVTRLYDEAFQLVDITG